MRLLLFNQDWFKEDFLAAGHQVVSVGVREHLDFVLPNPFIPLNNILQQLPGHYQPEAVIIYDESGPFFFSGIEDLEIPCLFYSVDIHHHAAYHRWLTHVFDVVFTAMKDYLPVFVPGPALLEWLPLWASRYMDASVVKKHGAVFVGALDPNLNPQRVKFFAELAQQCEIMCITGNFWEIFPYSEIVVNQTVKGDLNFRVFEAMISGALLLTEDSGNGLKELFEPDRHLVLYQKNSVAEAADKIAYWLAHKEQGREIGRAGRELILQRHCSQHRAARILELLPCLARRPSPLRYLATLPLYDWLFSTLDRKGFAESGLVVAHSLNLLQRALDCGETPDDELLFFAVRICFEHERWHHSGRGKAMLAVLQESFPDREILRCARIWRILNEEGRPAAEAAIRNLGIEPTTELIGRIADFMGTLLTRQVD